MRNKKVELLISIDHTGQRVYQSSRNKKIMPVVIYTDDESGAQNIDISRQRTNTSNLEWGIRCWREIIAIDTEANPNFRGINFAEQIADNPDDRDFYKYVSKQIKETIPSRIKKNYIHYGLDDPANISWLEIIRMAQCYLGTDPWLQISFCMDSTRQSVDEQVQRSMLNRYVPDGDFSKQRQGVYVYNGTIYNSKAELEAALRANGQQNVDRKDIDTVGELHGNTFQIFQKYAKVAGGHQDNVFTEALHFLRDSELYVQNNDDNIHFVAQLDGEYIEERTQDLRNEINSDRVFVGNSSEVIAWMNQIE